MNDDQAVTKRRKPVSKREARIAALIFVAIAILGLASCIHGYFKSSFLVDGSASNADMVHDMRMLIKVATFIVIPGLSILLILSSVYIWRLSKEIGNDSQR